MSWWCIPDMATRRKKWTDFAATACVQPSIFDPSTLAKEQPKRRKSGTFPKPNIPEGDILRQIYEGLLLHPLVARIERINVISGRILGPNGKPGRFLRSCKKGRSDLDGFSVTGKVIAIEVKTPSTRNKLSVEQRAYLDDVKRHGGLAGVATCVEEAFAIVEGRCS